MPPMTPANDLIQRLHAVIRTGAQHEIRLNALLSEVEKCVRKWEADHRADGMPTRDEMLNDLRREFPKSAPTAPHVPEPRTVPCEDCSHPLAKHHPQLGCVADGLAGCLCGNTNAEEKTP